MIKRGKLGSLRVDNPVGLHQVSPSPDGESVSTVIIDLKVAEDESAPFCIAPKVNEILVSRPDNGIKV